MSYGYAPVFALTNEGDLVFDPFSGVASAGVAALLHKRKFWGCEIIPEYMNQGKERLEQTVAGSIKYRPYDKPIYTLISRCNKPEVDIFFLARNIE